MNFLGIKLIFKTVINYMYNLVQIQQIHLAEEKQWSERLRNVTVIISEAPAFFQSGLTNRCWPSCTLPWLPRHSKGSSKQGYGLCQDAHPAISPLADDLLGIATQITRPEAEPGDGHTSFPCSSRNCPCRSSRSCSQTSPPKQITWFCQSICFVRNGAPPAATKGV